MGVGKNLSNLRKASGLSQDDIARALNITRPAYKQLETNEKEPSIAEVNAISELFGVRVELLTGSLDLPPILAIGGVAAGVDRIKYKNLILYLASRVGAWPNVGETVFYKLIYFIETLSYYKHRTSITNERFYKMQYGPVPASFQAITQEMINDNELDKVQGRYFTYRQTKYLPRVESSGLTSNDKMIINTIIERLGADSATYLSDLSHEDRPWLNAKDGEYVDFSLIFETTFESLKKMARE